MSDTHSRMELTADTPARLGVMPHPPADLDAAVMAGREVASGRLALMLDQIWDIDEAERPRVYLMIDGEGTVRRWDRIEELLQRPDLSDN